MREIMRYKELLTVELWESKTIVIDKITEIKERLKEAEELISINITVTATGSIDTSNSSFPQIRDLLLQDNSKKTSNNSWQFDVTKLVNECSDLLEKTVNETIEIENWVPSFSTDAALDIISKIEKTRNELNHTAQIFKAFKKDGVLGDSYRYGHGDQQFALQFGYIKFDRYPWRTLLNNPHGKENVHDYMNQVLQEVTGITNSLLQLQDLLRSRYESRTNPQYRTYIPTLRTARTLISHDGTRLESHNDIFQHTTVHDYQLAATGVIVDTGFSLYDAIDTTRNARHDGRNSFKDFELFLSTTFFNGKKVDVVAERVRDQRGGNILVAVEGVERDIHDLGDGIQTIIMLLYPLFIAPDKAWFFIEEPEVHLHPGFQRLFIETITTNKILRDKQLTIFLTTHSNHILDFALDDPHHVNIFTFRRREGSGNKSAYQIQLSSQRDIENLNLLGVQNSSVFLANCTIWVEGISDRIYFRAYLQAYLAHRIEKKQPTLSLVEGLHYTFIEYAGGNISHFDFTAQEGPFTTQTIEDIKALSISNRVLLVADQDAGKGTRHEARQSKEHDGFKYIVLTVKEVENMLSPALIAKGLSTLFKKRTFDATMLNQAEYSSVYIGAYLDEKYGSFDKSFTPKSGTPPRFTTIGSKYKRKLAEAVAHNLKWDEMSRTAQDFTKALYEFIKDHNPRLGSN